MDMPQAPEPAPQHKWLAKFAGSWVGSHTFDGGEVSLVEQGRMIGELWIAIDGGTTGDFDHQSQFLFGYDEPSGKATGTFVSSMMAELWSYSGNIDLQADRMELYSTGPRCDGEPGIQNYRDVFQFDGPDKRTLTSFAETPDGWVEFMRAEYIRR